ncbi:CDGSH iron-sulfur domain-containing protein 3, mitochondrial isoform X2 [Drosophila sulfurigaster albostrigata]|uniref:CDGSH iron-sulfur domain-containing protein 3, mitochondrial isoform X2 n=1 Tax=Drosophila sulfurigaster albostrigata TaxID=89887 RepID=UPI002D21C7A9|nr:CDGSH iron-sulfur domain-containing protein 3, mitochondrial isoform X2 [Drosophila sulfurigaster albostrigata]
MSVILRRNLQVPQLLKLSYSSSAKSSGDATATVKTVPKNLLEDKQTANLQKENGAIFDKRPFKLHLDKDKTYSWCLCGKSKSQPLCDGMHKNEFLKIKLRPIRFKVEKSGDYWLCNCKQTTHRPFCDGTHKQPEIQAAVK